MEKEQQPDNTIGGFTQRKAEIFAAGSSILAGGVLAWREILSESYANFTQLHLVDDIKQKFRREFGPKHSTALKSGMDREASVEAILKQNNKYNIAVAERMEQAGFESNTLAGFKNRAGLLSTHERWKIGLTASAISAVAAGTLATLIKEKFAKKAEHDIQPRPASFVQAEEEKPQEQATGHAK